MEGMAWIPGATPDPADYPGARPELLVPFSSVFVAPAFRPAAPAAVRSTALLTPGSRASTGGIPRASPAR
jgi:hypothetical protein